MVESQPPIPRPAATVMLLRDTESGPEVFLQRRVSAMAFAPNMCVYPGGGLDERDRSPGWLTGDNWAGPPPSWFAERLGCADELAAALVAAAVRETFEECGVLLAGPADGAAVDPTGRRYLAARAELVDDKGPLAAVLADAGWVLRADPLRPWARWITPEIEPRRYDTYFFVAALPDGQRADGDTTEADRTGWVRPAVALEAFRDGRIQLLPPTRVTLEELTPYGSVAEVLAAADQRGIEPVLPKVRREGEQLVVRVRGVDGAPTELSLLYPTGPARPTSPAPGRAPVVPPASAPGSPTGSPPGSAPRRGLLPPAPDGPRAAHPAYRELRAVTPTASVLLVDNPSPMTLDGTNTWLMRAPGSERAVVIDPGPLDEAHLQRVAATAPVEQILLTHRHHDHAEGAHRLAELTGAPVRALDPSLVLGAEGLAEGDVVTAAGLELRVLATPGHTSDSLSFLLEDAVLTGDTVLGRGTTVIDHPDGRLADYLGSLRRLAELPPGMAVLPGHGPELADAGEVARMYLAHREERLDQVRAALEQLGPEATPRQVVELVYADVDRVLWQAAEWSVQAQFEYLRN